MMKKTLWILTEERPKNAVIETIFMRFAQEFKIGFICSGSLKIVPLLKNGLFTFTYQVLGINTPQIQQILIKTVSGQSSFVDYLLYFQEQEPTQQDIPLFAIEETKTDDSESRNTGIFQRCSKFVYIDLFYPNIKKIMLYSLQIGQKQHPTKTNIFGSRLLATYGVEILGKKQTDKQQKPFQSIDELIAYKNAMRLPNKTNVPILIKKTANEIQISGRLIKKGTLSHDPNIGALSMISAVLRKLGWQKKIVITQHGLQKNNLPKTQKPNKFIQIAHQFDIELYGLMLPENKNRDYYWHYETTGEKLATIFIHLVVENFTQGYAVFENHAGCEKSYFHKSDGSVIPLAKYSNREEYKSGNKNAIIHIPDLILVDVERLQIINIEGKNYKNINQGIVELLNYDDIENIYIKPNYSQYTIIRSVVLYGSDLQNNEKLPIEIGFLLNKQGKMILGVFAPTLFIEAITHLLDYWKSDC